MVKVIDNSRKPYGEFQNVLLTDDERDKLIERFTESVFKDKVETLSVGIQSKGYKYKNHYATILAWDRKDQRDIGKGTSSKHANGKDDPDRFIKGRLGHMVARTIEDMKRIKGG